MNPSRKILSLLTTTLLIMLGFSFTSFGQSDWTLIKKQDGITFHYTNKVSKVNGAVNTIIKVENTTEKQVEVKFTPSTSCDGTTFTKQVEASAILASGDHSLYTYKLCDKNETPVVKLSNTNVNK